MFSYSGAAPSAATAAVDTTAQNLKLNLTVGATGYAGGGLTFDSCVNASSFTSVQFTAAITAGSLTGCTWQVQLQTQDQRDSTATNPSGGTCDATTTTCYRYPAVSRPGRADGRGQHLPGDLHALHQSGELDDLDADPGDRRSVAGELRIERRGDVHRGASHRQRHLSLGSPPAETRRYTPRHAGVARHRHVTSTSNPTRWRRSARPILDNASHSVKEPGVARFDVIQSVEDPTRFVLVEVYRSPEAQAAHKETAHYQRWRDAVAELMAEPRTSARYVDVFPDARVIG